MLIVFNPIANALSIFPAIACCIVRYIPPPGTKGIKAQIINVVTGVLQTRAKISEYSEILKT